MDSKSSPIKPWHRISMTGRQCFAAKPWKKAKMSQAKYERIISAVPQEYLDEIRLNVESEAFMERIFCKEFVEELD